MALSLDGLTIGADAGIGDSGGHGQIYLGQNIGSKFYVLDHIKSTDMIQSEGLSYSAQPQPCCLGSQGVLSELSIRLLLLVVLVLVLTQGWLVFIHIFFTAIVE